MNQPNQTAKVDSQTDRELADLFIMDWYYWSSSYRPKLGMPGCAPECRQAVSPKQWDSTTDITSDACDRANMQAVEWCINELPFSYQNAIGIEMKNREVKAKVWRSVHGKTYDEALDMIIPLMRKKNLL